MSLSAHLRSNSLQALVNGPIAHYGVLTTVRLLSEYVPTPRRTLSIDGERWIVTEAEKEETKINSIIELEMFPFLFISCHNSMARIPELTEYSGRVRAYFMNAPPEWYVHAITLPKSLLLVDYIKSLLVILASSSFKFNGSRRRQRASVRHRLDSFSGWTCPFAAMDEMA